MELHRLRYFVTVVEEGSFTRAAARLRLAQPGLSAQIARLERELGQRLLDRTGRAVTPTEVGAAVLPYARAALAAAEAVRDTAAEFAGLLRGRAPSVWFPAPPPSSTSRGSSPTSTRTIRGWRWPSRRAAPRRC
ncbi:LysR family transcriptional regulator [Streptomyces sp. NPDC058855]|uniref:LysR family transcriptional regulator n=1 Tax=Streptomyces sp. NPDC058855 TaxID=3346651 RepID=UPI0036CBF507